jgi:hypothetical protein
MRVFNRAEKYTRTYEDTEKVEVGNFYRKCNKKNSTVPCSVNGGLHCKAPHEGLCANTDPRLPKGESVSGKAEQYVGQ